MKKILVFGGLICALVLVLFFGFQSKTSAQPTGANIGRFQLLEANYSAINAGGLSFKEQSLFRIDTITGKTWIYREGVITTNKKVYQEWVPIGE